MTRIPAPTRTVTRSARRPRLTFALTALAALALAACGTEKPSAGGSQNRPADAVGAQPAAAQPAPDPQQVVAFMEMLNKVAQSCPSGPAGALHLGPPQGPQSNIPGEEPPTGPVPAPPSDAIEPIAPTTGPEVELNAREWCASKLHEERITQTLWDLADPTPAKVRKILNDLGYVDEHIHGLKQSGTTTRFFLDLRDKGGRLCLEGSAEGEKTVVESFAGPETGPFTPGKRN
ncbi:hypothetical protein ACWCXB_22875 [Streptomyces sp. NPDC001514]